MLNVNGSSGTPPPGHILVHSVILNIFSPRKEPSISDRFYESSHCYVDYLFETRHKKFIFTSTQDEPMKEQNC